MQRLMVFADDDADGENVQLPLRRAGQRGYGLDKNRRHSAEDFGSTSEEDEMVLHPLESVLRQIRERPLHAGRWAYCMSGALFAGMIGLMAGFTLAYSLFLTLEAPCAHSHVWRAGPSHVRQRVVAAVSARHIADTLRYLAARPHLAGTGDDQLLVDYVATRWREQGFDTVDISTYDVLLSYPNASQPNVVRIVDENGAPVFTCRHRQPPLWTPEERLNDLADNFNAYSATANVKAEFVYVNYARQQDFDTLRQHNISVRGRIVLARYGAVFRGNKVRACEREGCVGMVLYSDPAESAPAGLNWTYPASVYLPAGGAQLGTVYVGQGDPLTPFYPSTAEAFRLREQDADLPRIPVQPISAADASQLLSYLPVSDDVLPADWRGGLNVTYAMGPGPARSRWRLHLDIHTHTQRANVSNVIAILRGYEEPDRYVLLGNHRDSWTLGAVDPSSGTAAMLELSRVLLQLHRETGWRPRRSLVFCSWGGEEYGLVGSTEWVQQMRQQLHSGAVAYINVDLTLNGNATLRALGVPLLYDVIFESARAVPNPDPDQVQAGYGSVYDTWLRYRPDNYTNRPIVGYPGSGSDYNEFLVVEGIPVADLCYDSPSGAPYPMYHSIYETFFYVSRLQDIGLVHSAVVASVWGQVAVRLADDSVLPLNASRYAEFLQRALVDMDTMVSEQLATHNLSLGCIETAAQRFVAAAAHFHNTVLTRLDIDNPLALRRVNDVLMSVERWFIEPRGLPDRPQVRHLLLSPSQSNSYKSVAFPGLVDLLNGLTRLGADERATQWRKIELHLSVLCTAVDGAARALMGAL